MKPHQTLEERYYNFCKYAGKNFTGEKVNGVEKFLFDNTEAYIKVVTLMQDIHKLTEEKAVEMMSRIHDKIDKEM
jgi:ribulose bisphosphate carboxylase small subunit